MRLGGAAAVGEGLDRAERCARQHLTPRPTSTRPCTFFARRPPAFTPTARTITSGQRINRPDMLLLLLSSH